MTGLREPLEQYLRDCLYREFAFGQFDCALFVGEWADRLAGTELVKAVKGKYNDRESGARITDGNPMIYAMRVLSDAGFVAVDFHRLGDIVFLRRGALGIVYSIFDQQVIVSPSESIGLVFMPLVPESIARVISWDG